MTKLIDVIIPVFNGESYIADAIDTVLQQSVKSVRILVANDGSTDSSAQIVSALAKGADNITLLNLPHRGSSPTLNEALAHVTAEWVAFLDCDDLWHSLKLQKQLDYLTANQSVSMCFTELTEFNDAANVSTVHSARKQVMKGVCKSAMLCRRQVFDINGTFNTDADIGDFMEWFGRCQIQGIHHAILPEVLTYRRIHSSNMSTNASAGNYLKILRAHLQRKQQSE